MDSWNDYWNNLRHFYYIIELYMTIYYIIQNDNSGL